MLGVPLGLDENAATYIEKKLLGKLKFMVDRLVCVFSSSNFFQHCPCDSLYAHHPLKKWRKVAEKFDKQIWDAAQSILGWPIPDQIWKQVCLTPD